MLLVTNSDVFFFAFLFPMPSLDVYIHFYPASIRSSGPFFLKEFSMPWIWCSSLFRFCSGIMNVLAETTKCGRRAGHGFEGQYGVEQLYGLSEKIVEWSERKRIARDSRYLGHANRDLGRLISLDWYRSHRAKEQVKSKNRSGSIQDVRLSPPPSRCPWGTNSQRCFEDDPRVPVTPLPNLQVDLHWRRSDLRVIQESMTNARHGHARQSLLIFFWGWRLPDRVAGQRFETLTYGYGISSRWWNEFPS